MIPRTITARPNDDAFPARTDPDIIPLPGTNRRPERESAAAAPATGGEVGPRDILNALRYHSVLFLTLGTLTAIGLGAAAWLLVPAKYTTYAMVQVAQTDPRVRPSPTDAASRAEFATFIKTEANKILSTRTMLGALREPSYGIAQLPMIRNEEAPEAFLEEKIKTEQSETNQLIKVMLAGEDPVQITKIVNAVVDYYIGSEKFDQQRKAKQLETLTKRRDEIRRILGDNLTGFDKTYGMPAGAEAMTSKQQARQSRYLEFQSRKANLQFALSVARDDLKAAQDQLDRCDTMPVPMPPDLQARLESDVDVVAQIARVNRLNNNIQVHLRSAAATEGNRGIYQNLLHNRDQAVADLEARKQKVRTDFEAAYRFAERRRLTEKVEQLQDRVRNFAAQEELVIRELANPDLKDFDKEAVDRKTPERIQSQDEIQSLRMEANDLQGTILRLTTELDAPERVKIWQRAEVPTRSEIRKQLAITGFAGVFGLGLVGGCVSLYELRRKRVYGPKDPVFRRLALLGCVPDCDSPSVTTGRSDGLDPAGRAFFEAVDKVKTVVCRHMQRRRMQVLLVTSAAPGEGKSILAWHLALSLARTDKRTLFIDGNLRNPGLHNHFDIASHPGLSELLRGERPMPEVVQRAALDNLWCIAAGVCDDQARHALDKEALRKLLERARQEFDYVILDTCSIREAVDPLYLAQHADATVLSVRTFHSCTTDVERACQRLMILGTPLLGAVLTDASGAGCEL